MRSQAARAGGSSEQASGAPSILSWLDKLLSEVSGYSNAGPPALVSPLYLNGPHSKMDLVRLIPADVRNASQPAMAAAQEGRRGTGPSMRGLVPPSEDWNDLESIGQGFSISQHFSNRQSSPVHQAPSVHQRSTVQQTPMVYQNHSTQETPAMFQWPTMQQFPMVDSQAAVVDNFHYNYSPVDWHQNITTNDQKYDTDNSYHETARATHTTQMHNNQRHIVHNSCCDTVTQSTDTLHLNSSSAMENQRAGVPSESIPLRRPIIKCKRGLFFNKGITTHKYVPETRPC